MKNLTLLLEQNACRNVKSYIQSGNVVFERDKPPNNLGPLLESKFGFKPEVLFLAKEDFVKFVNDNPYTSAVGKDIHLYFCKETPNPDLERINKLKSETEKFSIKGRVFYLHAPDGIGRSKLAANAEKCLGVAATGRNLNTANKLLEMVSRIEGA